MKKIVLSLAAILLTSISFAKPAPAPDRKDSGSANAVAATSGLFQKDANGDVMMPTLEEMLGEPIDNLGMIGGNDALKSELVSFAKNYLGIRYRRGGKTPNGFDCSGFTSFVFRNFGMSIDSSSRTQALQGTRVNLSQVEVGDLLFFSGRRGGKTVGHVGMVIEVDEATGSLKFIHSASSKGITIQSFPDGGYYSNRFLHAQRVIEPEIVAAR